MLEFSQASIIERILIFYAARLVKDKKLRAKIRNEYDGLLR